MMNEPSWSPKPIGQITITFDVYCEYDIDLNDMADLARAELNGKIFDLDTPNGTVEVGLRD